MKKFISELKGKTAMTKDGQILGIIDNFVVDSATGDIVHVLIVPAQGIETRLFNQDAQGRIILPFPSMNSVRDVVVMNIS
jgi:sporulation protein YlmC with PRC-barrel domain